MVLAIAKLVAADLFEPEFPARTGQHEQRAVMAVPEAAMNEDQSIARRQYEIRRAGKRANVQPVPETHRVQSFPKSQFRLRVAPAYRAHVARALLWGVYVGQLLDSRKAPASSSCRARASSRNGF